MKRWVVRSGGFAALALCLGVPPVAAQEIARGIEARELLARIEGGSPPTILDVRRPEEFAEGHISGAINIPFTELEARVSELGVEKSAELVVYCRTGRRAAIAEATLSELGYTNLRDLDGHITAWSEAGHPLE